MKVGICLPVFDRSARPALDGARRAEAAGLDGVFAFDHLFPAGQPARPALSMVPLLAGVAGVTASLTVGPLAARVGLVPEPVLVAALTTVSVQSGGRLVAVLGAGDRRSAPESAAYGMVPGSLSERIGAVVRVGNHLHDAGVPVWIAGRHPTLVAAAAEAGWGWNTWAAPAADLRTWPGPGPATWAGPPPAPLDDPAGRAAVGRHLRSLAAVGAAWAVYAPAPPVRWDAAIDTLAGLAREVR